MQSEGTHMELKVLHQHGWSINRLAREFGLNWRTVKREVMSDGPRRYPDRAKPSALTPAQQAHVERRLAVCPVIRGTDLHHELCRDYGYASSYPSFARHLVGLRPPQVHEPELRFETDPGVQLQADWAHFGLFPLEGRLVELYGLVAILGYSRAPAVRFATDRTRQTTFSCLLHCLDDLSGVPAEVLTDRDPAFCIGAMSDGRAILAPEWVDLAAVLGTVPKACRPYRAKTKGKVERMVRETKESMVPWLSGQILPARPILADYDRLARCWIEELVLPRKHRTTHRVVADAWTQERPLLRPLPSRFLAASDHLPVVAPLPPIIDLAARRLGEHVQMRDLAEYEAAQ
jgi:transposase